MSDKYYIFTEETKSFPNMQVFKEMSKEGEEYTLAGRGKRMSKKAYCLYKINMKDFEEGTWLELDKFISECEIVNKAMVRTKPISRESLTGGTYEDTCFMSGYSKKQQNILIARYKDVWLYCDTNTNQLMFLDKSYIDENWEFEEVENKLDWTRETIKGVLTKSLDERLSQNLYDEFAK